MSEVRVLLARPACSPASLGPLRYASEMTRRWHRGEHDAVERSLEAESGTAGWRLMLEAARFVRDPARVPPPCGARERSVLLNAVATLGGVAAMQAFVAATADQPAGLEAIEELHLMARHAPLDVPADAAPDLLDDPALDVQVTERPGSRTALLVFTGGAQRLNGPLRLVHAWLRRLGVTVVYLRDVHGMHFLGGVRSLGSGYGETVAALRRLVAELGCDHVACIGSSSGSFGALRYALDLAAARVLCLAGPTVLDGSVPELLRRQALRAEPGEPVDPNQLDLAPMYEAADPRPRIRLVYGDANAWDRAEAERMAAIAGVELAPIPGLERHGVIPYLLSDGAFERHLAWLVERDPAAVAAAPASSSGRPLTAAVADPTLGG